MSSKRHTTAPTSRGIVHQVQQIQQLQQLQQFIREALKEAAGEREGLLGPEDFLSNSQTPAGDNARGRRGGRLYLKQQLIGRALAKTGAQAIPRGSDGDVVLGEGAWGIVIEVLYRGKRCAMKITRYKDDFRAYQQMHEVQKSLPNFVKRHVPHIWYTGAVHNNTSDRAGEFWVTIMEILQPLPPGIGIQGWGYGSLPDVNLLFEEIASKVVAALPGIIERAIRDNVNSATAATLLSRQLLSGGLRGEFAEISSPQRLSSHIGVNLDHEEFYPLKMGNKMAMGLVKDLRRLIARGIRDMRHETEFEHVSRAADEAIDNINLITGDIANAVQKLVGPMMREYIPIDYDERSSRADRPHSDPRLKKLDAALNWLATNGVAVYGDLHSGNALYRPSTGDIVAVDLGLWMVGDDIVDAGNDIDGATIDAIMGNW